MEANKIKIAENIFLWEQEINLVERNINIFIGIGLMNSKGEISIDLPLDILIIIGSILEIKKNINLKVTFGLADENAILQLGQNESIKIKEINRIVDIYFKKLNKILKYFDLLENSLIIKVSTLKEDEKYRNILLPENKNNAYENEQLRTMKYFNIIGYNYRLSWKGDKKRKHTNRDEEYFDNLYEKCFKEKPMNSIYIKSGKKSLPHGLGTAIPYSYYKNEIFSRLPFKVIDNFNFENEQIKKHTESILKYFIKNCAIDKESFNKFIKKCLYIDDEL